MTDQLPTCPPEGTPTDLPKNLLLAVSKLAPGWRHAIVWGRATTLVREPAPDQRTTARLADVAGKRKSVRTTVDVPRLLESVSLRLAHADGTRAFAYWVRIDGAKGWTSWVGTAERVGFMEPGQPPTYDVEWATFYAAVQWTDDEDEELEQAA